jgi:alanine racemase
MPRPIRCTVSIAALQRNLSVARTHALGAGHSGVWAVVKAAAYGHGLDNAIQGFVEADGLAMLDFSDAVYCRKAGWTRPILLLEGPFCAADVQLAQQFQLDLVVHQAQQIAWIQQLASGLINVHLKFNTGMNRLGFRPDQANACINQLRNTGRLGKLTLMTHLANADLPRSDITKTSVVSIEQQLKQFAPVRFLGESLGLAVSLGNSAATLIDLPANGWARPGVMLYGASPMAEQTASALKLSAAMALDSELIAVQQLSAGDQVGYGSTFTASRSTRIGVVACGYADGYPRHAPTGTPVIVSGQRTRLIGRVSMDMLTVDLTDLSADVGSPVQLWGAQLPIDEVAQAAGTIGYELMCAVAPRVNRISSADFLTSK